ncbi:sirohydrochlorin chelatase [Alkalihalobacillus pseudalcaliphilus]|uniref:sirohydrochlorin chelatase n=1 Tax=Alkalihalobacillus pseudalcaliphilus TaxID=79884 RepID=UPI00064D952A|nr:sirohydrochlorin chelatase [Alkalihalobacillus pseudalcaliphilus]KMK76057.1 hypothetical protein AB990_12560 [Alkalihalobacillus pseudalcaliphilus]
MQAILYVGHGSRVKEGNEQLRAFVHKVQNLFSHIPIQEIGFIELESPTIREGLKACVVQGATKITVIPILLLSAGHAKQDIPDELSDFQDEYPNVRIRYGRPIGVEKGVIRILQDRLETVNIPKLNQKPLQTERLPQTVLLIGRGSSDPDANSDLCKIARLLWEFTPVKQVEVCFLAATEPTLEEGIEKILRSETEKLILLPYLLFTGVLMKSLEQKKKVIESQGRKQVKLADYLGFDHQLVPIISKRVEEVLEESDE